ncbi:unnamed protein product [Effrenium voratum]|uniref:Uncharacterized protein n=1 Tax=Effrenium voratum TaxID=2562239 RepID=A0AA36JNV6_9DINO|nr:unnamed protein product [Effrenium voratum]
MGSSVAVQAAAAAEAANRSAAELGLEDSLVLAAASAAVLSGAPEAQSAELAQLAEKAAEAQGFGPLGQAEAAAWAAATGAGGGAVAAAEASEAVRPHEEELPEVQTAAASVAMEGAWERPKNNFGELMESQQVFGHEMSLHLGRSDPRMHETEGEDRLSLPFWLPILAAFFCCLGMVAWLASCRTQKVKKSLRTASVDANPEEETLLPSCKAGGCKDFDRSQEAEEPPTAELPVVERLGGKLES